MSTEAKVIMVGLLFAAVTCPVFVVLSRFSQWWLLGLVVQALYLGVLILYGIIFKMGKEMRAWVAGGK